jgi:hypothetical protein
MIMGNWSDKKKPTSTAVNSELEPLGIAHDTGGKSMKKL